VEQGGPGAEIADDEDRLLDVLFFQVGEKEVVQAVGQPDSKVPEGVKKENENEDEESLGGEAARGSFGFEEADVDRFEKQLDIWDHGVTSVLSARVSRDCAEVWLRRGVTNVDLSQQLLYLHAGKTQSLWQAHPVKTL
jgi:hypothetical protein